MSRRSLSGPPQKKYQLVLRCRKENEILNAATNTHAKQLLKYNNIHI